MDYVKNLYLISYNIASIVYVLIFLFFFFGCQACGILALWPGNELAPPALRGEVLTIGPPGKSQKSQN